MSIFLLLDIKYRNENYTRNIYVIKLNVLNGYKETNIKYLQYFM